MILSSAVLAFISLRRDAFIHPEDGGKDMIDAPEGFWQWAASGLAAIVAGGGALLGKGFMGQTKAAQERTDEAIRDLWSVIDTERKSESEYRERMLSFMAGTAQRDEMHKQLQAIREEVRAGFQGVRAEILSIARKN